MTNITNILRVKKQNFGFHYQLIVFHLSISEQEYKLTTYIFQEKDISLLHVYVLCDDFKPWFKT